MFVVSSIAGAPHLMSTPGSTNLYDTAATAAAERLKKERTYKSKVGGLGLSHTRTATPHTALLVPMCLRPSHHHARFLLPCLSRTSTCGALPLTHPVSAFLQARNIIVTNWCMGGVPQLMESFSLFTPAGSTVSFVLPEEAPTTWPSRLGGCRFNFLTADNPTGVKVGAFGATPTVGHYSWA